MDTGLAAFLAARREAYMAERRRDLGDDEYNPSRSQWDAIWETEWRVIEERIRGGATIGPTPAALEAAYGEDYIDRVAASVLEDEVRLVSSEFVELTSDDGSITLPYVYYEDFISLSNQGIFRLDGFLLDRQRRWEKNVVSELATYGYQRIGTVVVNGDALIQFRRSA
jgi:hypothetical protein